MAEKKKKGIICRSEREFEEIFLPRTFERRQKEQGMREPESFGKVLEKDLITCIREGKSCRGK